MGAVHQLEDVVLQRLDADRQAVHPERLHDLQPLDAVLPDERPGIDVVVELPALRQIEPPSEVFQEPSKLLGIEVGRRAAADEDRAGLNPVEPQLAAQTGDNTRDNVEQISLLAPLPGVYSVHISCKHALPECGQHYSLLVTGEILPFAAR